METALVKINAVRKHLNGEGICNKDEGEWIGKVEIMTKKKYLAVVEASMVGCGSKPAGLINSFVVQSPPKGVN